MGNSTAEIFDVFFNGRKAKPDKQVSELAAVCADLQKENARLKAEAVTAENYLLAMRVENMNLNRRIFELEKTYQEYREAVISGK